MRERREMGEMGSQSVHTEPPFFGIFRQDLSAERDSSDACAVNGGLVPVHISVRGLCVSGDRPAGSVKRDQGPSATRLRSGDLHVREEDGCSEWLSKRDVKEK
jgi:hypothetical protein